MGYNKIIFGGVTKLDLTADTITPSDVQSGVTFHDAEGEPQTGTSTLDSDTSEDTALIAEVLNGRTFHARGSAMTGTMPNRGAIAETISTKDGVVTIPNGYHDGSGTVGLATSEKNKLIPSNIKSGIVLFGVEGEYSGEGATAQSKTVTPTMAQQTILPDSGVDYLSQVIVNAIPYTETPNIGNGITLTIG